jgi:hypothetical protein
VKQPTAFLIGITIAASLAVAPPASAAGAGACTISGTISFQPSAGDGLWEISPALMECRGVFNGWERILGPGAFKGSGTYRPVPTAGGDCLHSFATGTIDYWIPTSEQDVHLTEPHDFMLSQAGEFRTPTLRGGFQIIRPDDDCLTTSTFKAIFLAQVTLARFRSPLVRAPGGTEVGP